MDLFKEIDKILYSEIEDIGGEDDVGSEIGSEVPPEERPKNEPDDEDSEPSARDNNYIFNADDAEVSDEKNHWDISSEDKAKTYFEFLTGATKAPAEGYPDGATFKEYFDAFINDWYMGSQKEFERKALGAIQSKYPHLRAGVSKFAGSYPTVKTAEPEED